MAIKNKSEKIFVFKQFGVKKNKINKIPQYCSSKLKDDSPSVRDGRNSWYDPKAFDPRTHQPCKDDRFVARDMSTNLCLSSCCHYGHSTQ